MKTPAKWWADLQHGDNVIADIVARDAEHRAELLKLQDDLLAGADREVMATALIERLRGELGEAKQAIVEREEKWNAIEEKRHSVMAWARRDECRYLLSKIGPAVPESSAPHDPTVPRGAPCPPAPSPAESTPVRPALPDDIRARPSVVYATQAQLDQRMRMVSERLDALEAKGEPGTHAKGAKP